MRNTTFGIAALLLLLSPLLVAQEGGGNRRVQSVGHAFERIEKSLRELTALPAYDADAEVRALVEKIRSHARELQRVLEKKPDAKQILYDIRLIDLEAKGARDAWKERFGAVPDGPESMPAGFESKLKDLPGLLAAPRILALDGQKAELSLGEEKEISYLKRIESGHYVTEQTKVRDGLALSLVGSLDDDKTVDLRLDFDVSRIVGKTEFARDAPTVGMPLIEQRVGRARLRIAPGRHQLVMPIVDGEGSIVIIIGAWFPFTDEEPKRAR